MNLSTNYYLLSALKKWLVPFIIAALLFVVVRPVLAQTLETPHDVKVGTVSGRDYFSQIYYEFNGASEVITDNRYTSASPAAAGEYIAWVGQIDGLWQVFLYNLSSKTTTQLTFTGNNVNPKVDEKGRVVWEGWSSGDTTWQIYFFDGSGIHKLTTGDTSLNPNISGEYISFARRDISGTWRAVVYSIADGKSVDVAIGEKTRNPQIRNGDIYFAAGTTDEEKFPLSVSDLFLLNLPPLAATGSATPSATLTPEPTPVTVTQEEIMEELNATPSASPVGTGTPEASSSGELEAQPTPKTLEP